MKKLKALQKHLLDSALDIPAENLMVFVTAGKISSTAGRANKHFSSRYDGNIIIVKNTHALSEITYVLLDWLHVNQPNLGGDDIIEFKADIIDAKSTDLHLIIKLDEVTRCTVTEQGVSLIADDAPDMDQIMAQGLGMKVDAHNED